MGLGLGLGSEVGRRCWALGLGGKVQGRGLGAGLGSGVGGGVRRWG